MAAAGGAIRIFPHMLQLSGFVFERGGTCREPSHEPRPTDQLDDGRPNMPPSAFPMDYPIRFDVFESHLRFPVVFQNSNRRRFFFWKFHCCFRARRPRRHNIQTTITRWITCRKQNIGKKERRTFEMWLRNHRRLFLTRLSQICSSPKTTLTSIFISVS